MNRATLMLMLLAYLPTGWAYGQAPTTPAANEAIPAQTLDTMYRRELGPLYSPQIADKLHDAHLLIEKYFAASKAAERKTLIKELEEIAINPNVIGRLVRIRLYWPQLETGAYYINERVGPHNVNYFLGIPKDYDRTRPWPLVIKLPGAHPFVTDPRPTADEVARIYTDWIKEELTKHPDAVILMPMLNLDELWGPSYVGMNSVIQPLYHVAGRVNIDPARVYLMGHGMSGHATWNLSIHYPTYFAAINPMSGGTGGPWQKLRVMNLRNIYSIVWHDAEDQVLKVDLSREMVKLLRNLKYDVDYEETKGVGHAPSDEIAERQYTKMRSRTRELYPKEVVEGSNRPDALFNRNDWVQVYQQLVTGGDHRTRFGLGTGMVTFNNNSYRINAVITGPNRIEAKSDNVETMRFYLNDQMVDFSMPVTVVVNTKVRFEGMVKPRIEVMLNDQMFLGRGWRYYTGFVDVDFGNLPPATRKGSADAKPNQ